VLVILLAVVVAIGWGASDYFGGDTSGRDRPVFTTVALAELIGLALMIPVLAVRGTLPPADPGLALAAVAGVAVTVELSLIYRALGNGQAFITAPVGALGAAIAVSAGLISGDPLSLIIAAGLVLALAGGAISSWTSPGRSGRRAPVRTAATCLTAAAGVAAALTCLHAAGRVDPYWAAFTEHASTALSAGLIALVRERRPRRPSSPSSPSGQFDRRRLTGLAIIALTGLGGDLGYTVASQHGSLSILAAISSLYPITTIALALLLKGTRPTRTQLVGITVALLGTVLLSISH
jgi:drug/metabolite transporter (DMT)-like permease